MTWPRRFLRTYWLDVLIVVLVLEGMTEIIVGRHSSNAPRSLWFALPALAVLVLPLFARRRFPFAGLTAYWVIAAVIGFVDWRPVPNAASLLVVGLTVAFLLGNLRDDLRAAAGLVIVIAGATIIVYVIPDHTASELVFVPLEFAVAWVAGFALRERAEQAEAAEHRASIAERERDAAARVAVAEERARIARELHDIVAHSVSVMVLQVGAVRHKLPENFVEDRNALTGVEHAGRTALAEMRRLLAAMRPDGHEAELAPQPGLDGLDALIGAIGRAGLPVTLHIDGAPVSLPRGIELSAYRIVQEGLTNALKHANATTADVTVRYRTDGVEIEVRDNGRGATTSDGLGHGLVGIGERVKLYGGEMSAGTGDGGGYVLSTRLPLNGDRP